MPTSNLKIPTVALGTWAWGDSGEIGDGYFGAHFTHAELEEIVDKAQLAGFTIWDTARVYGMGRAETVLGGILKNYRRSNFQLSTKFTPQIADASDEPVAVMLEQSLAALQTDYVDFYWIHNPADVSRWTPHLIPLLESGRIRHVGVSNHSLIQIKAADQILGEAGFRIEAVQNHYSLLYRSSERAGIVEYCHDRGIPFFAYMVLEQGALTGKYTPENPLPEGGNRAENYNPILPRLRALTDKLTSIGQRLGAQAADVAVAWAMAKGAAPIIGVTKPHHVEGLIRADGIRLSVDEIGELEALADAADVNTRGWWERDVEL